ncbi:MAG TPA: MmgE/PrpD family protein [Vicinamibacterales bacterium]|nr:MmgE/PrpD family protein [Vicinamibacterales bacterium]
MPLAGELAAFAVDVEVPEAARERARAAWIDTIGVILAGSVEPAARLVQALVRADGGLPRCHLLGGDLLTSPGLAALANGTAAHALDFDDMCFVSLAHPSAPLVPAAIAAGEIAAASGRALLDAYVVGFEIEAVLGRAMHPSHYARGWHATSTLGTIGAAAAAARLLGLDRAGAACALAIAASSACGLKENFGTMVKPLHAGMAARDGIMAALLARDGFTASPLALDGPQGFIAALSNARRDGTSVRDLGRRWDIVESGITMKLYPSCAATHPALDAILDLRREHGLAARDVVAVAVMVDAVTPSVLLYADPQSGLEAKFSMPFCAAFAIVHGDVGIDAFDDAGLHDEGVRRLATRVSMIVDPEVGIGAPALTQARVALTLADGRVLRAAADGARGYPDRPATADAARDKFISCARRTLTPAAAATAYERVCNLPALIDARDLAAWVSGR